MDSRCVESFEHDLSHLLSVVLGVQRSFSEENWVFLRSDTKPVEDLKPDPPHAIPAGYNTLNGIIEGPRVALGSAFYRKLANRCYPMDTGTYLM